MSELLVASLATSGDGGSLAAVPGVEVKTDVLLLELRVLHLPVHLVHIGLGLQLGKLSLNGRQPVTRRTSPLSSSSLGRYLSSQPIIWKTKNKFSNCAK